ncbi:MAG: carboxypeptidase-like regulatory domain-containing protein, partial [Limisphaerales bacterium]
GGGKAVAAAAGGLMAILGTLKAKLILGAAVVTLGVAPFLFSSRHGSTSSVAGATAPDSENRAMANAGGSGSDRETTLAPAGGSTAVEEDNGQRLVLTLLAADSGEPVPNVPIDYRGWEGSHFTSQELEGNRAGTCEISVVEGTTQLELTTRVEGFADTRLAWRPERGQVIPAEYTLRLARAVPIGGTVIDSDGQLVAGAKVSFGHGGEPAVDPGVESHLFGWIEVETDAEGRWQIQRLAETMLRRITGSAKHPEHVDSDYLFVGREAGAEDQLRAGTYVFQLGRPLTVRGSVVTTDGEPVSGASVSVGRVAESGRREATSEADGSFAIAGCKPGENVLSAAAPGFAPTTLAVTLTQADDPFRLVLESGKTLRFKVVDRAGVPLAGANIWYNPFRSLPPGASRSFPVQAEFKAQTDDQGIAVWENVPDQEMPFDVHKRGYMRVDDIRARPDGQEHVVVLPPALTIRGTVSDAVSGKPIPQFRIITGWPQGNPPNGTAAPQWSPLERFWLKFDGGTFQHSLEEAVLGGIPNPGYVFKFEAEGYAPHITRTVAADEGEVEFAVQLSPGKSTEVQVVSPEGNPVANADVGLVTAGVDLRLLPGSLDRRRGLFSYTDIDGRFRLAADPAIAKVIVVHGSGFAEATPAQLEAEPLLWLQPWGRIEGRCWRGGEPTEGREFTLSFVDGGLPSISFDFQAYRVKSDAEGRFVFAKVPPARLQLIELIPSPQQPAEGASWAHKPTAVVEVRPGEVTQIEVGNTDRRVTLRLRLPEGMAGAGGGQLAFAVITSPVPLPPKEIRGDPAATAQWFQRPEIQTLIQAARAFPLRPAGDGSWNGEEVAPGSYVLRTALAPPGTESNAAMPPQMFEVPVVIPEGTPGSLLDLGELIVQPIE